MMGNYLVRFLGGDGGASLPTYPVHTRFGQYIKEGIFNYDMPLKGLMLMFHPLSGTYSERVNSNIKYITEMPWFMAILLSRKISGQRPIT